MKRWWALMSILACISANAAEPIDYPTRDPNGVGQAQRIDQPI